MIRPQKVSLYISSVLLLVTGVVLIATLGFAGNTNSTFAVPAGPMPASTSEKPIVTFIELGSAKCIPCKAMKKVMAELEVEYPNDLKIIFHDVWTDAGRPMGDKYGIRSIPTQVFLDANGKEFFRHEGFFPKNEIVEMLKKRKVSH